MMSNVVPLPEDYAIGAITPAQLHVVWDEVVPHLERVIEVSHGDLTLASVRNRLVAGEQQLYVVSRHGEIVAVFCTDVQTLESGLRVLRVPIIGGEELDLWVDYAVSAWRRLARELMCDRIRGLGRQGWTRKLAPYGIKACHVVYEMPVED